MSLAWPWALAALLVPPLLLGYAWWMRRRRRRDAVRVTSIALVRSAVPGRSRWLRRIPAGVLLLGLCVLAVGAARPQGSVPVADSSTSILLALDVSGSMCSTDVQPNRLTAAEKAAEGFVRSQSGARIGLVPFAGTAGVLVPPTTDTGKLLDALDSLATSRGTAIGQAILTSIDAIAEIDPSVASTGARVAPRPPAAGYAPDVIVVLTDGANTQGVSPATAAKEAAARGIRIFTIGFGTTSPSPHVCDSSQFGDNSFAGGGFYYLGGGASGTGNPLVADVGTLQQISKATGGHFYRAADADQLDAALSDLPRKLTLTRRHVDLAPWFAGAGGLLVAGATVLSLWLNRVRRPADA